MTPDELQRLITSWPPRGVDLDAYERELLTQETLRDLEALLSHPDSRVRINAATAVGMWNVGSLLPRLLALLDQDDPLVRSAAVFSIGLICDARPTEARRQLQRALGDSNVSVQLQAVQALGRIGIADSKDAVIHMLQHQHVSVRISAIEALGAPGSGVDPGVLKPFLTDPDRSVCLAVGCALLKLGDAGGLSHVIEALHSDNRQYVHFALEALKLAKHSSAVHDIIRVLESPDRGILLHAITVLGDIRSPAALPNLEKLLNQSDETVQNLIRTSISMIKSAGR